MIEVSEEKRRWKRRKESVDIGQRIFNLTARGSMIAPASWCSKDLDADNSRNYSE
jgi:hypothetical protein